MVHDPGVALDRSLAAAVRRLDLAARAHVARAIQKHGMTTPADCYEPTMRELWEAALAIWPGDPVLAPADAAGEGG